jgi:hypothetical protein
MSLVPLYVFGRSGYFAPALAPGNAALGFESFGLPIAWNFLPFFRSHLFPWEFRPMYSDSSQVFPRPVVDVEAKLEPTLQAAGEARRFVARELDALGYSRLVDDARVVVSELVTNSVRHVPGKPVWVGLRRSGKYVVLEVWDCSPDRPVAPDPDFVGENGRGLHVVGKLGVRSGYDIFCCGKVAWVGNRGLERLWPRSGIRSLAWAFPWWSG